MAFNSTRARSGAKLSVFYALAAWALSLAAAGPAAAWQADERIVHYDVPGKTGMEIYQAIGRLGPQPTPARRAIALTEWDLKWGRDYVPDGNDCVLAAARPFLKITYRLPRASQQLSPDLQARWDAFHAGMLAHEKVHGDFLKDLANRILADTVGLRVANDRTCRAIRDEVLRRVEAAYLDYRARNTDFERAEMSDGGRVHGLILQLVDPR